MGVYLITGGCGFIGSHIAERLLSEGHEVVVLDNLSTGHEHNLKHLSGPITFVHGAAGDEVVVRKLMSSKKIDGIFHQAAIPSVPRSINEPLQCQLSGEVATLTLLRCAVDAGVKRVVYAGSSSVYGDTPTLPKVEDMAPSPKSPYAVSKLAGESYMTVFAKCYPIDTVTLRYFNVFGPRQDPASPYSGVMARFLTAIRAGERPVIFGDGNQTRDFTYVSNAVDGNLLAMFNPQPLGGAVINIASGDRVSLLEVVSAFNEVLGTKFEPDFKPERAGDVRDSLADLSKARTLLGFTPRIHWRDGIKKLVAYA
ncbi:MAG: NAD-dependent epimerase/dehydratase family protein [Verrucomicrobiota bacterium]|nr:NAD-dependent epimerase/dehydratase family protein [Verrucomicrobiota bacterium]